MCTRARLAQQWDRAVEGTRGGAPLGQWGPLAPIGGCPRLTIGTHHWLAIIAPARKPLSPLAPSQALALKLNLHHRYIMLIKGAVLIWCH